MKLDARAKEIYFRRKGNVNYEVLGLDENGVLTILIYNQNTYKPIGENGKRETVHSTK